MMMMYVSNIGCAKYEGIPKTTRTIMPQSQSRMPVLRHRIGMKLSFGPRMHNRGPDGVRIMTSDDPKIGDAECEPIPKAAHKAVFTTLQDQPVWPLGRWLGVKANFWNHNVNL